MGMGNSCIMCFYRLLLLPFCGTPLSSTKGVNRFPAKNERPMEILTQRFLTKSQCG